MSPFLPESGVAPDVSSDIVRLVQSGQKIEAIKLYRRTTQLGLKEAKDFIDHLEQRLAGGVIDPSTVHVPVAPPPDPRGMPRKAVTTAKKGYGCGAILFVFLFGAVVGIALAAVFPSTMEVVRGFLFAPGARSI